MNLHVILDIAAIGMVATAIYLRTTIVITVKKEADMPGLKQRIAKLESQQIDTSNLVTRPELDAVAQRVGVVEHELDNNDPEQVASQDDTVAEQAAG